jgi:hypothetical protein
LGDEIIVFDKGKRDLIVPQKSATLEMTWGETAATQV